MSGSRENTGNLWINYPYEVVSQYRFFGIGGWLAVFLIILTISQAFSIIFIALLISEILPTYSTIHPSWKSIFNAMIGIFVVNIIFTSVVLTQGFLKKRAFPKTVKFFLGFCFIQSSYTIWMELQMSEAGYVDMTGGDAFIITIINLLYHASLIWYFTSSKRVNATYLLRLNPDDPEVTTLIKWFAPTEVTRPSAPSNQPLAYAGTSGHPPSRQSASLPTGAKIDTPATSGTPSEFVTQIQQQGAWRSIKLYQSQEAAEIALQAVLAVTPCQAGRVLQAYLKDGNKRYRPVLTLLGNAAQPQSSGGPSHA